MHLIVLLAQLIMSSFSFSLPSLSYFSVFPASLPPSSLSLSFPVVEDYINGMLNRKLRIMGFGHRVYKVEDPRSRHLRRYSERLCAAESALAPLFEISHRIEKTVISRKTIRPNVDFYSATVQRALRIPKDLFTCIFAVARTAGWIGHVREQFADNRLIRPTSNYIGGYQKKWVPLNDRREEDEGCEGDDKLEATTPTAIAAKTTASAAEKTSTIQTISV